AKSEVARAIADVVEVARNLPRRSQHHDAAGMRKLIIALVVNVAEANRLRELLDGFLVAGQEMPALLCPRSAVALQVRFLLGGGHLGSVARVKADRDHIELVTSIERQIQHGPHQAVEHLRAEHRTSEVCEYQYDRLALEIVAQVHLLPGFIL